jgi:hypothetical protein
MVKQAKKRVAAMAAEEQVSLIGKDGQPAPGPSLRPQRSHKLGLVESLLQAWTLHRLMKYMALCVMTAVLTFLVLRKEQKSLHWEQYNSLLEPEAKEQRCYVSPRNARRNVCYVTLRYVTLCYVLNRSRRSVLYWSRVESSQVEWSQNTDSIVLILFYFI